MLAETDLQITGRGFDGWVVVHAVIREALSEVYEAAVVITHPDPHADPSPLLGQPATLLCERGSVENRVHGVVRALEDLGSTGTHRYARLYAVPWLWTLGQRTDSRIFQEMPVVDIVKAVFSAARVYDGSRGRLIASDELRQLPPREYCVQYRETDLAFVLRLLQEEGIPFYFRHGEESGETLVLAEEGHGWSPPTLLEAGDLVRVSDTFAATSAVETVQTFDPQLAMRPTSTTLREYDFTRPGLHLGAGTTMSPGAAGERPLYDYPARATLHGYVDDGHAFTAYDGQRQSRIRQEAAAMTAVTAQGRGNVTGFRPGIRARVDGHHAGARDGRYLLTVVEHRYDAWSDLPDDVRGSERITRALESAGVRPRGRGGFAQRYENRFTVIPADTVFRPERVTPRPIVQGPQTAKVVGPQGEEIHVDFHGRIKVQFHWDREGLHDDESSCWIRCSQSWSGPGWGFQFIPRIGMEVVVTFLEGDPDRPLVTGSVYNGENHYPYGLPGEKTKSTVKTNSSPTTGGYNEIRFEDRAGDEQVYVQAERNHDTLVKNDQTLTVGNNRTKLIEANERNTIVKDRMTTVHGNESKEIDGNQDVQIHGFSGATLHVDEHYHVTADEGLVLECGNSKITMTPGTIDIYSNRIKMRGEKLVEIIGELVKINCPEGSHEAAHGGKKKRNRFKDLFTRMKRGIEKVLAKLPAPLRRALRRLVSGALRQTIQALMRGRLPDVAAIARGALGEVAQGMLHTAMSAMNAGFERLGALDWVRGNPLLEGMLNAARGQVAQGLGRAQQVIQGFLGVVGGHEAWQQAQRAHPEAALRVLRSVGAPMVREAMMRVEVPRGIGRNGLRLFDEAAKISRINC